jgi:hypothetical protein
MNHEVESGQAFGGGYPNNDEAAAAGCGRAKQDQTEHVIHNQNGTISERNSYGNDLASQRGDPSVSARIEGWPPGGSVVEGACAEAERDSSGENARGQPCVSRFGGRIDGPPNTTAT